MKKVLIVMAALALANCGTDEARDADTRDYDVLTVLAASSLTETFTELAEEFEKAGGPEVKLVFDSSATLAQQVLEGGPGEALATADRRTMDTVRTAGLLEGSDGDPVQFATNVLVLALPEDNPAKIDSLDDLDDPDVDYLTCVPTAPCGSAAENLLRKNEVTRPPASQEVDVKAVLAKVAAGEADAGVVYRTDVTASDGTVIGIDIPGAEADPNTYWLGIIDRGDGDYASDWIAFVTGPEGRRVLTEAGFGPPQE